MIPGHLRAVVSLGLAALALGCGEPPEAQRRPNFILLLVDALRADRLHYAGHASIATPNFDRLQSTSTWFANAYSTSPWTLPAVASLFTAQLSSTHGAIDFRSNLPEGAPTLAQLLRNAGYRTGAWSASRLIVPARGALQGFEETKLVHHPLRENRRYPVGSPLRVAPANMVSAPALAWMRRAAADPEGRPFFAYLHYMEPHTPYLCPRERVHEIECRNRAEAINEKLIGRDWDFDATERSLVEAFYDADIERMDAEIGNLMDELASAGLLDDSFVVLVADHGELLGERGGFLHGKALYQPLVHVPMLIRTPDAVGRVVETPVSIIDVAPTIAALAGIEAPGVWQGRSLAAALDGSPLSGRPVVAELYMPDPFSNHRLAVLDGADKYVLDVSGDVMTRVQIERDPDEEHPLPARPEDLEGILARARLWVDLQSYVPPEAAELTAEQRKQLEALGYLGAEPPATSNAGASADTDP